MRESRALAQGAVEFLSKHPGVSMMALGSGAHADSLDLSPLGVPVHYLPAERNLDLAAQYLALNQLAFGGIGVPRWVLSDLYLLPGAIGLLRCPARMVKREVRERLGLADEDPTIGAAYYAAPSVTPGLFIGVSLLSCLPGTGAAPWVKVLTLAMMRATRLRGVAQWDNPSVRVHARLGPLRLVGRVPGGHEYGERTFVYESDLSDGARVAEAMERRLSLSPTRRVSVTDLPTLSGLLDRAEAGEELHLVPPGQDAGHVLVREGAL
ncbi:hypothetical protein JY651_45275 [Pyxidicoccus parkwayensis]|uniref:Uncharacterized protein n=1 Tax=Pyxidicoccus parkwayensis TaxID=2813578 RepID=A0ABX7NXZ2_9BACT|nr:hypothetical protein [Pyxidicoccus parkwaysis]QSQ22264.1 hypothetical protein JY651_45275 [Pyxidicoccus parkwaysis]